MPNGPSTHWQEASDTIRTNNPGDPGSSLTATYKVLVTLDAILEHRVQEIRDEIPHLRQVVATGVGGFSAGNQKSSREGF